MANKTLFSSIKSKLPRADTHNEAGGRAYKFTPKHALAQMAATGCFNGVYYARAESQLDEMRKLIAQVDDDVFLAKLAVYARERAYMKDMPAALLVILSKRDTKLMHQVFDRVVDNGRVLRTMFQMIRSGQFGRTSLSSSLQRAFQRWLNEASVGKLLSASIGHDPSLRDILRMARPTPKDNARRALFGWLTDKEAKLFHIIPCKDCDLHKIHPEEKERGHYLKEHVWNHIIKRHIWKVFLWTFFALLIVQLGLKYWELEGFVKEYMGLVLLISVLIGIIPESGPHLIFVMMFANGLIPFSVLLASSIAQDGHGMLPLVSYTIRDTLLIKIFNIGAALLVGGIAFGMGW